jgi:hypothetical protein
MELIELENIWKEYDKKIHYLIMFMTCLTGTIQNGMLSTQSKLKPKISKPIAHISLDFSAHNKSRLTDKLMVDNFKNIEREHSWNYVGNNKI